MLKVESLQEMELRGAYLIEASAGTGKTFRLIELYLRLLRQGLAASGDTPEPLSVRQIAVLTFTNAATKEIRHRLVERLSSELRRISEECGDVGEDEAKFLDGVYRRALLELDEAAIYTIHGFCQQVLKRFALETSLALKEEFSLNSDATILKVARQIWRKWSYVSSPYKERLFAGMYNSPEKVASVFGMEQLHGSMDGSTAGSTDGSTSRGISIHPDLTSGVGSRVNHTKAKRTVNRAAKSWDIALDAALDEYERIVSRLRVDLVGQEERIFDLIYSGNINKRKYNSQYLKLWLHQIAQALGRDNLGRDNLGSDNLGGEDMLFASTKLASFSRASLLANNLSPECADNEVLILLDELYRLCCELRVLLFRCVREDFQAALETEQAQTGLVFPKDLIARLASALYSDRGANGGGRLAGLLRALYPVMLVDEFQDTDAEQWAIFNAVYFAGIGADIGARSSADKIVGDSVGASASSTATTTATTTVNNVQLLIAIGDPKQSIYRFRGADVFTYLRAKMEIGGMEISGGSGDRITTLDTNWRSHPGVVDSVNYLFTRIPNPFIANGIDFEPVRSSYVANAADISGASACEEGDSCNTEINAEIKVCPKFVVDGQSEPQVRFWRVRFSKAGADSDDKDCGSEQTPEEVQQADGEEAKKASVSRSRQKERTPSAVQVAAVVADRILNLIEKGSDGGAQLDGRPLTARDFAVLVPSHRHAAIVREACEKRGLTVGYASRASVFQTAEALDVWHFVLALLYPVNRSVIRGALSMRGFAISAGEWRSIVEGDAWGSWALSRFQEYAKLWAGKGICVAFDKFCQDFQIMERVVQSGRGMRRMTNYSHIIELLSKAEYNLPSIYRLPWWLADEMNAEVASSEEQVLRMEGEEDAVRLVTIHASKGLEYNIVLHPFLDAMGQQRVTDCLYHDESGALWLDLSPTGEKKEEVRQEMAAESMRLLYVALTRAKVQNVIVLNDLERCAKSPFGQLLFSRSVLSADGGVKAKGGKKALLGFKEPSSRDGLSDGADGVAKDKNTAEVMEEDLLQVVGEMNSFRDGVCRLDEQVVSVAEATLGRSSLRLKAAAGRETEASSLAALSFSRRLWRNWRLSSYSYLTRSKVDGVHGAPAVAAASEVVKEDDVEVVGDMVEAGVEVDVAEGMREQLGEQYSPADVAESSLLHGFPVGAATGNFLHGYLERFDWSRREPDYAARLAVEELSRGGLDVGLKDALVDLSQRVGTLDFGRIGSRIGSPMSSSLGNLRVNNLRVNNLRVNNVRVNNVGVDNTHENSVHEGDDCSNALSACLRDTAAHARKVEWEFNWRLSDLRCSALRELFIGEGFFASAVLDIDFDSHEGVLKGFIDLVFEHNGVFYIVDYKSNYLGNQLSDYSVNALSKSVVEHHYYLQYALYTAAVVRYMQVYYGEGSFNYEAQFGGVFYLYLRGLGQTHHLALSSAPSSTFSSASSSLSSNAPSILPSGVYYDKPRWSTIDGLIRLLEGRS